MRKGQSLKACAAYKLRTSLLSIGSRGGPRAGRRGRRRWPWPIQTALAGTRPGRHPLHQEYLKHLQYMVRKFREEVISALLTNQ